MAIRYCTNPIYNIVREVGEEGACPLSIVQYPVRLRSRGGDTRPAVAPDGILVPPKISLKAHPPSIPKICIAFFHPELSRNPTNPIYNMVTQVRRAYVPTTSAPILREDCG